MKIIKSLAIMAATIFMSACAGSQEPKSLVLYYSQTGTTKVVAEAIQSLTGADIEAIELENPYDGDFMATVMRAQQEGRDNVLPTLKSLNVNIDNYDTIYLGYPIWSGTYASPITALLKEQDFSGKKIVPFCTFGSGGLETSAKDLKAALPNSEVAEGYGARAARTAAVPQEVERFLKENGYIEGEVEALPEFSEQQPVSEAEKALFDAACSSYQFPLGTPVTVGKREIQAGTEYKFAVDNGSTIYVIASQGSAEFTRVVR